MTSSYQINQSFNKYKINSPIDCGFYVMEVAQEILKEYNLNQITKEIFIEFYNKYLMKKIKKDLSSFIEERTNKWQQFEKSINYNTLKEYVTETFINKSFIGIKREQKVFDELNFHLPTGYTISHSNPDEDCQKGIDFLIDGDIKIGIQVKPVSFIYGLKKTTKYSLRKIVKTKPTDIPLFIITESKNIIQVHLKSKNSNKLTTIPLDKFLSYLKSDNAENKYSQISNNTFKAMMQI